MGMSGWMAGAEFHSSLVSSALHSHFVGAHYFHSPSTIHRFMYIVKHKLGHSVPETYSANDGRRAHVLRSEIKQTANNGAHSAVVHVNEVESPSLLSAQGPFDGAHAAYIAAQGI